MSMCAAPPVSHGLVSSMARFIDCQAEALASGAWQALALPGSTLSLVLSTFLTLFVAFIGYNLLLGHSLNVRSGTLAMVKIGAVLALATSWPAYRTLVYDLTVHAPSQLVAEIGAPAGIPGSDGTLLQRIDLADQALAQLAILGPGNPMMGAAEPTAQPQIPSPFAGFNAFALGGARILFLLGAIAALAVVRIVAGLMLALGPFFIAFLLFDNTRSLFEGWIRILAGAALGAVGAAITLGLQLALLEPWLTSILARRQAGEALPSVPTELLVIVSVFAILMIAVVVACARLARGFRLAPWIQSLAPRETVERSGSPALALSMDQQQQRTEQRTRAADVTDIVVAAQRRDARAAAAPAAGYEPQRVQIAGTDRPNGPANSILQAPGLGHTFRRRTRSRGSASAERLDRRA